MRTSPDRIEQARRNLINSIETLNKASNKPYMCITLWADLLGFSKHLNQFDFNSETINENLGLKRISLFHEASILAMKDFVTIVQLNDATIFSADLMDGNPDEIITNFFALADYFWEVSNIADKEIGGLGIRGVVSIGNRYSLRGNFGWTPTNKEIISPNFASPPAIQMNMPFAKSYKLESSGLLRKEPALYIEEDIFINYRPAYIQNWSNDELLIANDLGNYRLVRYENEN